jgi:hypothetical protein
VCRLDAGSAEPQQVALAGGAAVRSGRDCVRWRGARLSVGAWEERWYCCLAGRGWRSSQDWTRGRERLQRASWWMLVVLGMIVAYALALVLTGVGGVLLLRDLFKPNIRSM